MYFVYDKLGELRSRSLNIEVILLMSDGLLQRLQLVRDLYKSLLYVPLFLLHSFSVQVLTRISEVVSVGVLKIW